MYQIENQAEIHDLRYEGPSTWRPSRSTSTK